MATIYRLFETESEGGVAALLYHQSNHPDRTHLICCRTRAWIQIRRVKERGRGDGYAA
jgi:hypothetical protein